jgi:hypothetical protein
MAKHGRPNQFDAIILSAVGAAVRGGIDLTTLAEDVEEISDGTLSMRGLNDAALRLFRAGRLVRAYRYKGGSHPTKDPLVRRYLYWLPQYGPKDAEFVG